MKRRRFSSSIWTSLSLVENVVTVWIAWNRKGLCWCRYQLVMSGARSIKGKDGNILDLKKFRRSSAWFGHGDGAGDGNPAEGDCEPRIVLWEFRRVVFAQDMYVGTPSPFRG